TEVAAGDITVDAVPNADDIKGVPGDAVTKSVTLEVNVGAPVNGEEGSNPFEGYTAEEAASAMYWDGDTPPQLTDVGGIGKSILLTTKLIQYASKAARGDQAAMRIFLYLYPNVSPEVQRAVQMDLANKWGMFADFAAAHPDLSKNIKEIADGLWELLMQMGDLPIVGPDTQSPESLYVDASRSSTTAGGLSSDAVNKGACGQVAAAVTSDPGTATTILPSGPHWVRVTLIGTQHGPLVHELKTLGTPAVYCPPVSVSATAGQVNMLHITPGCTGTVTSVRLATRAEANALSLTDQAQLLTPTGDVKTDWLADAIAYRTYDPSDATAAGAVSLVADGNAAISGDSSAGNLSYKPGLSTGASTDAIVAMATGTDGKEHPFMVRIAVKTPPSCSAADGFVDAGHTTHIQNGRLELQRNTTFRIDPKLLCTTDPRDTYSVTMNESIPGTTSKINTDGSVTYTWTDPDKIGTDGAITVTGWDRDSGAPSTPVTIPIHIRDAAPVCADIPIRYDTTAMAGAPLTIPLNCTMTGGLKALNPPMPMIVLGTDGGRTLATPGGTFTVTPTNITFTPTPGYTGTSSATIMTSSSTPFTNNLDGLNGKAFVITVTSG
ncbi:MAG: hypothetical protein JWQ19_2662, partial [Subtercola sp.]|nr:hypothetical protein [Subtercola sp.]